jgi:predicted phosphodiesterase
MKVLFIGDVHCNSDWKKVLQDNLAYNPSLDHVVFLGDYVDSFYHNGKVCKDALIDVISEARKLGDKCTLLLGNHDYAYIHNKTGISGYNYGHANQYTQIFYQHRDLFKIAWGYENPATYKYTLATHAGLTHTFYT